ncbi:rab3 GTPase-activating protein non-catalytic subunit [Phtheirospermum japonicum]|uniref:Rab3 GTPase-activating protein non-catalytic subunit n=1 Tax=Phtheirospermum japonicum TaxID=374723 RepID=A0A830B0E2_9LAMI|nr:rab3 GTPase-activating protein non-catalytic subunit [Phtheirospermum japonicum]
MSRRNHTTELGCIAGEDLSDLGAGKEGWLVNNPNLLASLDTHSLALASRSLILILNWSQSINGMPDPDNHRSVKIQPELSPIESEYISAVEWLVFDDDIRVLAVGTSCGYLLIFSIHGRLIHRQIVNPGKILKLRVRGIKQDLTQDTSSEEVCVVMPGVVARFDGSDIKNMLQRWFHETDSQFWDQDSDDSFPEDYGTPISTLPYQIWNVSKYGLCADAAITGVMPPPLMEIQSSQRYYCAVTVGDDAVISAFRLSVDKNRSLVGAILSKVVPATFSTIASFSKLIWRSEEKQTKKPEAKTQPFARASPLTCVKDYPRKGEKLTLSPSGTLAAITDSLGRILLLDTQALVVVRLWKGYREASCLFVEMLAGKDKAASRPTDSEHSKGDYCLCLAIHAPRKGIVEVWQMRTGPRLVTIPCPKGSKILQPTYRFSSTKASSSSYVPLEVFFLNGDSGQISVLNRFLH